MSSSISNNIRIDIPEEYLENGKTLLIEKYFELFVDGCHLSKPSHFIRRVQDLCLIDAQQQDLRAVKSNHQLQSNTDENEHVQLIIEFPPKALLGGKSIRIEKIDSNEEEKPSGNVEDLYNMNTEIKNINIKLPNKCLERGKTIIIHKENILIIENNDQHKETTHHLNNNQFTKRDHLQSKNLMEITIEIPPDYFHHGQTITLTKEDPQLVEANFPYHRQ